MPSELDRLDPVWLGDFDGMRERRLIRVLTVIENGLYFLDGGVQHGLVYEMANLFEEQLNKVLDTGDSPFKVLMVPVSQDKLIPYLLEGRGDIAAAFLTVTPERLQQVDFSDPLYTDIEEVVIAGAQGGDLATIEDLSGKDIHVRQSSSYYENLRQLNRRFREAGIDEVNLTVADEHLADPELLEMVSAGLLPLTVVDSVKASFWAQILDSLTVRTDLVVNSGGEIAWALRKNSPLLMREVNDFVETVHQGTLLGNIEFNRYLRSTKWLNNPVATSEVDLFQTTGVFFREYGTQYDLDWLLLAAQGYQESGLDQTVTSSAGAIGVMQLLPATAKDPNVNISDIDRVENNIHAGAKYLRFLRDRYFSDEPVDDFNAMLLSFAAYNAGPNRISALRQDAVASGLDPNIWFDNVEHMVAKAVGRETVTYVNNIYKYYIAYRLSLDLQDASRGEPRR